MERQIQLFSEFEDKLKGFIDAHNELNKENKILNTEKEQFKEKLLNLSVENRELKDENDRLKMVNAMLGGKEHRRLMKIKINKLIKEVDQCIVQLKH